MIGVPAVPADPRPAVPVVPADPVPKSTAVLCSSDAVPIPVWKCIELQCSSMRFSQFQLFYSENHPCLAIKQKTSDTVHCWRQCRMQMTLKIFGMFFCAKVFESLPFSGFFWLQSFLKCSPYKEFKSSPRRGFLYNCITTINL